MLRDSCCFECKNFLICKYVLTEYVRLRSAGKRTMKSKVDQEQENPDDFREPSVEENERMSSALEYELPVEDMGDFSSAITHDIIGERKLIHVDRRSELNR